MFYISNVAKCENKPHEVAVKSNQSVPLAQMDKMRKSGQAIAQSALEGHAYYDSANGVTQVENMPLEYTRGIDENILFEASVESREKIRTWRKKMQKKDNEVGTKANT